MSKPMSDQQDDAKTFESAAAEGRKSFLGEIFAWLGDNQKWWLLPIVITMVLLGALILFGGATGGTPFIYTLF